jgi:hypothetical protein
MRKTSLASLEERLADWNDWDMAAYQVGACLGFWPEFGGPIAYGADPWNGVKGIMWSNHPISESIYNFIDELVKAGMLEMRLEPDTAYRWNPNYNGTGTTEV